MTLNAIAEGRSAKRRRAEMRMLRAYAAQPHGNPDTCHPEKQLTKLSTDCVLSDARHISKAQCMLAQEPAALCAAQLTELEATDPTAQTLPCSPQRRAAALRQGRKSHQGSGPPKHVLVKV